MTEQAQNALLKTIEEPPEYGVIFLLTTSATTFLPTILSRCVLLDLKPVNQEIIKRELMHKHGMPDYQALIPDLRAESCPADNSILCMLAITIG